jgi:hypothetical protein
MIVPPHRRPNGLEAELDALVAREVDALALRKARAPNGKPAYDQLAEDQAAPEPAMQADDIRPDDMAAHASHPHDVVGRRRRRKSAATNVIGIRHGNPSGGLTGIPFSADEEGFIEEAVAFLRRRVNADVILDEIWTHALASHDEDDEHLLGEQAGAAEEHHDDAAGSDEDALCDDTPAPDRHRIAPEQAATARHPPEGAEQIAGGDTTPPAIRVVPPRSDKRPAAKDPGNDGAVP